MWSVDAVSHPNDPARTGRAPCHIDCSAGVGRMEGEKERSTDGRMDGWMDGLPAAAVAPVRCPDGDEGGCVQTMFAVCQGRWRLISLVDGERHVQYFRNYLTAHRYTIMSPDKRRNHSRRVSPTASDYWIWNLLQQFWHQYSFWADTDTYFTGSEMACLYEELIYPALNF